MALVTEGIQAYWTFDESSGTASDSSGNGNTLANNNTTAYAAGQINNGVDLEASSTNWMSIVDGSQTGLDLTGDLAASFWIKMESQPSSGNQMVIFGKFTSSGDQRSYSLRYKNDGGTPKIILLVNDDGLGASSEDLAFTQTLSNGTLYHVAVTWDASTSTAECWVDDSSLGTVTGTVTSIFDGTADFTVGAVNSGGDAMDGVIDELCIWDRLITDTDVGWLYNSGRGMQYPFQTNEITII